MLSQVFRADHRMRTAMDYQYETVDVFTATRFGGNPLAVILDARGLSDRQMQQIATEFNDSETTVVLPLEHPGNTARIRIFTPTAEVLFAGHPNVGTAFVLARHNQVVVRGACVPVMAGVLTL